MRVNTGQDYISDSYTSDDVILGWMDNSPVEMNLEELTLPQFELERTGTRPCKDLLKTGKHCPVKTDPTRILYMFLIVFCRFLRHVGTRFELV